MLAIAGVVVWLGVLQLRAFNGDVNPDGISYIEIAKLFSRGDVSALSNGYWSPLYPLVVAIALRLSDLWPGASPAELSVVLATNLIVFGLAVARDRASRSVLTLQVVTEPPPGLSCCAPPWLPRSACGRSSGWLAFRRLLPTRCSPSCCFLSPPTSRKQPMHYRQIAARSPSAYSSASATGRSLCSCPSRSSPSARTCSSAATHRGDACSRDPLWDWRSSRDRSSPCSHGRRIICRSANPGG